MTKMSGKNLGWIFGRRRALALVVLFVCVFFEIIVIPWAGYLCFLVAKNGNPLGRVEMGECLGIWNLDKGL
jgi:hypothetical protein